MSPFSLKDANTTAASVHYNYDTLNRAVSMAQTINSVPFTMNYSYDKAGNRTKLTYPSGKIVEYTYDVDDRLDLVKVSGVTLADYNYDSLDRRAAKTLFAGSTQQQASYSFDLGNQLSNLTNTLLPATKISQYAYPSYDRVGNRKTLNRTQFPSRCTNWAGTIDGNCFIAREVLDEGAILVLFLE